MAMPFSRVYTRKATTDQDAQSYKISIKLGLGIPIERILDGTVFISFAKPTYQYITFCFYMQQMFEKMWERGMYVTDLFNMHKDDILLPVVMC